MHDLIPFFTKTKWHEPPRIRHQLAHLLASHGHPVRFFQRPTYRAIRMQRSRDAGTELIAHAELLNHQFRIVSLLRRANAAVVSHYIRKACGDSVPSAALNFNYEYGFLRDLFPDTRIVTIINDDFASQALLPGMRSVIGRQMAETCRRSDCVLVTAPALRDKLAPANANTQLFLPWAEAPYAPPSTKGKRDVALYWGYINHRIDWGIMEELAASGLRLRIVGPVGSGHQNRLKEVRRHANITVLPATPLDTLDVSDVCCSIIPYDLSRKSTQACTPNKIFNLLALGIPSVYMKLETNIDAPDSVIRKCVTADDFEDSILFFQKHFHDVQPEIKLFLKHHTADTRYRQLQDALALEG